MKLFDEVATKLGSGAIGGGAGGNFVTSVLEMLSNRDGGIAGLAKSFQQNRLGDIVSSWIGTGQNLPVSAEQIQQVFGKEEIQAIAQKTGTSSEVASTQVAEVLPSLIDKLTPGGEMPQGDLMSTGMRLLQGLMSGAKSAAP